ncbi:MAG TPA: hypothetical protein VMD59_07055, partial [Acidimicrobiales bacterium]|nr:hypothetical protein [Acidimicrobiales bacterium]
MAAIFGAAAGSGTQGLIVSVQHHGTSSSVGLAASILPQGPGQGGPGPVVARSGIAWVQVAGAVYRSTDDGAHWRLVLPAQPDEATSCGCAGGAYFFGTEDAWVPRMDETPAVTFVVDRILYSTDGGRRWRSSTPLPGLPPPSTVPGLGLSLSFVNARVGYALASGSRVGPGGSDVLTTLLWLTEDGGRSWRVVQSSSLPLDGLVGDSGLFDDSPTRCGYDGELSLSFVTPTQGFISAGACSAKTPGLWASDDAGRQWRSVHLAAPPDGWRGGVPEAGIPAVTSSGSAIVGVSTDGGEVVVERRQPGGAFQVAGVLDTGALGRPAALEALDGEDLVVPASDGLWRSSDAGVTWRLSADRLDLAALGAIWLAPPGSIGGQGRGLGLVATWGPSDSNPDAVGPAPLAGALVLRTTDGGLSWQPAGTVNAPAGPQPPYDLVEFADARTGYLAGLSGIASSADGGRSWRSEWDDGLPVRALDLYGARGVAAITQDELLVRGAGGSWRAVAEPVGGALSSVAFAGRDVAYGAVCSSQPYDWSPGGELVASSDGGRSWRVLRLPARVKDCPEVTAGQPAGGAEAGLGAARSGAVVCVASPRVLYAIGEPAG